ncbi:uncharacterized protein LODBEIA_P14510 [Lodderomyces beijingensis]|uniref:very-long-chain (3R)-3-hydroxyacyl-CoA dehydratase n=1 Tax=Lodderomyces beijingensis TaxID=1775926 RepID=A0ABP0ZGD5_9ASCO
MSQRSVSLPFEKRLIFFVDVVAATLWFCCLARFLILLPLVGRRFLPGGIADFFHVVSLTPLMATSAVVLFNQHKRPFKAYFWSLLNGLKMAWICYGVIFPHPKIAKHTAYSFLITAWSTQYFLHFTYLAFRERTRSSPFFLFWAQYNNFYVTYPVELVAEMSMIFLSLGFLTEDSYYAIVIKAVFVSYIPIAYFAWGHLKKRKAVKYSEVAEKLRAARRNEREMRSPGVRG